MARFPWRRHASGIEVLEAHYAVRHSRFPLLRRALCWLQSLRQRDHGETISEEEREFTRPRSGEYTNWRFETSDFGGHAVDDVESSEIMMGEDIDRADALAATCSTGSRRLAHRNISGEETQYLSTLRDHPVGGLREAW